MNICKSYGLSREFVKNMHTLEAQNIMHHDAGNSSDGKRYLAIERMTDTYNKKNKTTMVIGALLYAILHPKDMVKAQKYYSQKFGKPCALDQ